MLITKDFVYFEHVPSALRKTAITQISIWTVDEPDNTVCDRGIYVHTATTRLCIRVKGTLEDVKNTMKQLIIDLASDETTEICTIPLQ